MNCETFRKLINQDESQISQEQELGLEAHLDKCSSCNEWLETVISKAPVGLETLETLVAPASTFPANVKPIITQAPEPQKAKSVTGSFFAGLKYGLVFGVSVVCGLAVVSIINDSKPISLLKNRDIPSFVQLEEKQDQIPSFLEQDFYANSSFINEGENNAAGLDAFLLNDNFYSLNFEEETLDG
jgi:hypothetical protein